MSMRKRLAAILLLLGLVFGAATVVAPSAQARGGPIVYNQSGGYVPISWGTRDSAGIARWTRNSTRYDMWCYADDGWSYGNYWSNRWYLGVIYDTGQSVWIHSSYVYYQWSVPPC
jgi:hypothetical protein